ncbi:unnamed protein product [Plutella xylostella]|uniref:(diamondback moth) hypothetical protein n=1 Tax=Plutella xylostella TaxID=51655 RepID=A0A8S4FZN4_PLUXY|nr:unnamed protein product [Plutella xylostella]
MGAASDGTAWLRGKVAAMRESRKLVLVIVAIALLLDNMLLTTVGDAWTTGAASDGTAWLRGKVAAMRESRKLVLVIVAIALLLDNMLLTTVGDAWATGAASDGTAWLRGKVAAMRESRKLVLVIVAIALLLDNMLLTTVGDAWATGAASDGTAWLRGKVAAMRESRKLVLVIVAIALLLDNMLLTTVVPIIPEFLYDIRHPDAPLSQSLEDLTTPAPLPTPYCPCLEKNQTDVLENATRAHLNLSVEREERHQKLVHETNPLEPVGGARGEAPGAHHETVEVGVMFASKALVQLLAKPSIGYSVPMFTGFILMFLSTLIFAFGRSYSVLFIARALQGIGSSCSSVSGWACWLRDTRMISSVSWMGMLAERYPDDKERGNAMGIALGGLALGVLIGPPFGGLMYEFVGKTAPFLMLSALALADGLLQLMILQPGVVRQDTDPPSLKELVCDPYIIVAAGAITFANVGIAMLEPSLPIWMVDTMQSSRWQQGVAFLPASICYLIGTNLFGPLGHKMGRWLAALSGLLIIGVCLILVRKNNMYSYHSYKSNVRVRLEHLIIPNAGLGFAIGMVDSSMMPELGFLVDIRPRRRLRLRVRYWRYAFCPAFSGWLVNSIGFEWMLVIIAFLNFSYAPFLLILRSPPATGRETESHNK